MNHCYKTSLLTVSFLWAISAMAADTIRGTVHNETIGKPSAGDEVVLLRLGAGMQEESRTKTDAQGAFTLNVALPQDQHLIQVFHQGVNYDQPVRGAGPVEIVVYDAVAKIPDLRGPIGIAQVQSNGKILKITENYEITNSSNPPVTQSGAGNFQVFVPPQAVFDSVQVRRGQGIWLKVDPVKENSGAYAIHYPIRPGETSLQLVFTLPYRGPTTLHLKVPYPIEKFGVMHPSSMSFKAVRPGTFESASISPNVIGELVAAKPLLSDVPAFEISGTGAAPEHGTEAEAAAPPSTPSVVAAPNNVHTTENSAPSAAGQSRKELWLMIAGIITILGVGGFTFWRRQTRGAPTLTSATPAGGKPLLDALKEELFQLENSRLHGTISAEEYAVSKRALSLSIERAMTRNSSTEKL
jgi:hypothetical protein